MAITSTKAIVMNSIKYGDSSLIVRLYTEEYGLVSYMLKGVLKSKKGKLKAAYFQPLTLLSVVCSHQEKRSLQSLRDAQVTYMYQKIPLDIVKQSVAMFLTPDSHFEEKHCRSRISKCSKRNHQYCPRTY